jgi:peptidoglycan/xylan/chitin deacetylase (PgdA/CDA1 family)
LEGNIVDAFFMLSIDTELKWGYRLHPNTKMARMLHNDEGKALAAIDALLRLLENYEVPATWAVVGKLFFQHPEILDKILGSTTKHEIGYHSFSHIRFSESSRAAAEEELNHGLEIQDEFGLDFKSFVFPGNLIGHVDLLRQFGFLIYRGPDLAGKNVNKSLPIRAKNVAVSKFVAPPVEPLWKERIWQIPSSMEFYDVPFFQTLSLRAKNGIRRAIATGTTFHPFIHPEDVLRDPKLLDRLENVLQFVSSRVEAKQLRSITMGDFASSL